DAVPVLERVLRDERVRRHRAGEHVPCVALLDDPRGAIASAGLRTGVRGDVEPERLAVVVGGLPCVPDVVLDVVDPLDGHEVVGGVRHPSPPRFEELSVPPGSGALYGQAAKTVPWPYS